jgi:hypothetical protein
MIQVDGVIDNNKQIKRDFYNSEWSSNNSLENFKQGLVDLVDHNANKTFYKFSDGEYFWLVNNQVGSASAGKRDSNITKRDLTPFKEGVHKTDFKMCQLLNEHVKWFNSYFGSTFDFPVDYVYALVANKWFTKTFNGKIGLIGAGPKLDLIKDLCNHQEYLDYLQFDGFTDYIKMPQRYLCDDIDEAEEIMAEQLQKSTSNIFLVGIGHAQQALLHRMKKYKNAVYIVVGSGIDAYAGVQDNTRPYMAGWTNYQLVDYDYSTIDIWKNNFTNKKTI